MMLYNFPKQKLESSKKDKKWATDCINHIIDYSNSQFKEDTVRMIQAYKLVNSMLDEEDYKAICQNMGISLKHGEKYIQAYNKTGNILATLKGEELSRPFSYSAINISPSATNEAMRQEELEYRKYMDAKFSAEMEIMIKEIQLEARAQEEGMGSSSVSAAKQNIRAEVESKYGDLLDLAAIKEKHKSKISQTEGAVNRLLRIASTRQNFKWLKNQTFADAATAGKELVELCFEEGDPLPKIKQVNPLNGFYHKSPNSPFVHESDFAGYKEELTYGQTSDLLYAKMDKEDKKKFDQVLTSIGGGTYVEEQQNHMSYPTGLNMDPYARVVVDGLVKGVPHKRSYGASTNDVIGPGLYGDAKDYADPYVTVYTVYWKSYRKGYKYEYQNEYGEMVEEFVDESFVIPSTAKKKSYKDSKFGPAKWKYVWYAEDGKYNSLEDIWIPEIWKGKRVASDIFVDIGPLENAYQSLLSPYTSKIPIYGMVYGSRNTTVVSVIDKLAPWQKLYYAVMSKLIRKLSQDKGVLTFLNTLMIDKNIGWRKTLEIAEESGFIAYNPLAYTKGAQFSNTFHVADRVDATNSEVINHYISLLQFIESNLSESVGMSPQRLAQTKSRTTATDNERETIHSMNMTESLYYDHDILWEHILQGYMEMLIAAVNDKSGKLKGFLDDGQIAVVELGDISLEDEYLLKVANNTKANKIFLQAQSWAVALLQNDKANLSTLIKLMTHDDLKEFTEDLQKIEDDIQKREDAMRKAAEEDKNKMIREELANREDIQKARLDEIYLKSLGDKEREHIRGNYMVTSYNLQNDKNGNGVPDLMEENEKFTRLMTDINETVREQERKDKKMALEEQSLEQRQQEHEDNMRAKEDKLKLDEKKLKQKNNGGGK